VAAPASTDSRVERSVWRRLALVLGAILLALSAVPGYFVVRAKFFPPTFDVPSIAAAPHYQDAALLERAWRLPVAATYGGRVAFQSNGSVCGPSSVSNALRSLGEPLDEAGVLEGSGKCRFGICLGGLDLDELSRVAQAKTRRKVSLLRDLTPTELQRHLRRSNDSSCRYLVNFHRGLLFGKGVGHHSPIGGYLEAEDLVFVLDVNESFGPWLVERERLFRAIDSIDGARGRKRGLLLIE
jgi:hypothetical protein